MSEKLTQLIAKVEMLLDVVDGLKDQNSSLMKDNKQLQKELGEARGECESLRLSSADQSGAVKARLTAVMTRLDELEQLPL